MANVPKLLLHSDGGAPGSRRDPRNRRGQCFLHLRRVLLAVEPQHARAEQGVLRSHGRQVEALSQPVERMDLGVPRHADPLARVRGLREGSDGLQDFRRDPPFHSQVGRAYRNREAKFSVALRQDLKQRGNIGGFIAGFKDVRARHFQQPVDEPLQPVGIMCDIA